MKTRNLFSAALALCLIASSSVFAASTAPQIKITSPKAKASTTNASITISGTTSSSIAVTNVFYSLNGSDWVAASTSNNWVNWTADAALITPGTNTIAAFAAVGNGALSVTSSVSFTYRVLAPLTLQINPPGAGTIKIAPKETGGMLPINQTVTLTAKATKGFAFANWTDGIGGVITNSTALKFAMASNSTYAANFSDVLRPVCVILSPKAKQQVTTAAFTVTGKASDNVAISNVFYSFNGLAWQSAATSDNFSNWTADVNLTLGTNTIQAFAEDTSGNNSLTNKITFVYAQSTISGAWRASEFRTPAQIALNGGGLTAGGDSFNVATGNLTVNGNGTLSGNLENSVSGTYQIGNNGIVNVSITGNGSHTLFVNAGRDFMVTVDSQFDTDNNQQQLLLFQREPASVAASDIAGFWNATSFNSPAQVASDGNGGVVGGDLFGTHTGSATVNANGTLSVNLGDGPMNATYSIGKQGIFTVKNTSNGQTQTHTLFLNANKDILINAQAANDPTDDQQLLIFQRAPASLLPTEITGTWNATRFHTPAQISSDGFGGLNGGDNFSVGTGTLTLNTDGSFTAHLDEDSTGTYTIGANGVITINIVGEGSRTLFINAGKDLLITSDSENDVNDNRQELIIFQRPPNN